MNSYQTTISGRRPQLAGLWALLLVLCTLGLALPANAASFEAISKTLDTSLETCPNGVIDPGETNTVTFRFKNKEGRQLNNLKVRMVSASGNVDFAVDGTKTVGNVANNAEFTVTFRFRAGGACGATLSPSFQTAEGDGAFSNATLAQSSKFNFQLGLTVTDSTTHSFSNSGAITINDFTSNNQGKASPYPSTITVANVPNESGVTGERVSKVTVTLHGISHNFSRDINALLVAPNGTEIILMREAGGATTSSAPISDVTLTFDSAASSQLPAAGQIVSGTFKPSDFAPGTSLPSAAPEGPYETDLGLLKSEEGNREQRNPNGDWKLFIQDDQLADGGTIAGGWSLNFTTQKIVCCGAGETSPTITQGGSPSIAKVTVQEDNKFQSDDSSPELATLPTFRVSDIETSGANLTVTKSSSNQSLITDSNIKLTRTATGTAADGVTKFADYSMDFKPVANAFGTSTITITVTDASGRSSSASFTLEVESVNDTPTYPTFPRNQSVNIGSSTPPLSFSVSDVETAAGNLIVTGTSSSQAVVPDQNIIFSGTGADRTVTIIPAQTGPSGTSGQTTIELVLRDANDGARTESFIVNFNTQPGDPTISPISNQSVSEDGTKTVGFTIRSDSATPVNNLVLTAGSGNTTLLPPANITFSGTGTEREVTLRPVADLSGTASVTITVNDGTKDSETTFTLTVEEVNDAPTLSDISTQTINEDAATGDIPFTVGDKETAATAFVAGANSGPRITASSSNTSLVPNSGITFGGSGADRTIKITPAANAFGRAVITLTITDSGRSGDGGDVKSTSKTFLVNVNAVNDAPTIAQTIANNDISGNPVTTALAADTAPIAVTIPEDVELETVDNVTRVEEQTITLDGITAGLGDETEQTVTISASLDSTSVVESVRFDPASDANVKSPTTSTTLKYRPKRNAFGEATVTLTLTDDSAQGAQSITRKFKIKINPVNDQPSIANIPDQTGTFSNQQGVAVPINVSDTETPRASLTLTAVSDNQSLVKDSNITFDAANSVVAIVPESTADGTVTITVTVEDNGENNNGVNKLTATDTFTVTFGNVPINNPPTITVAPTTTAIDEDSVATATVTVDDGDAAADAAVTLSGTSSNTAIVKNENILFGGSGATRSVAIVPEANANGVVTITITGTDPSGLSSAPKTIEVTIRPVEDNPTISASRSGANGTKWIDTNNDGTRDTITANEGADPVADVTTSSDLIEVTVSDAETSGDNLTVTATSGNTDLIPNANIEVSSTGGTRTIRLKPVDNRPTSGSETSTITVKVRDSAGRETTTTFDVRIDAVNDEPTLNEIANMTIDEDAGLQTVSLTGITAGGGESQTLTITATSDKTSLIPNPTVNYTSPAETGTITFTPVANQFGAAKITVTVTDNGASGSPHDNSRSREFTVTVREVNDAPQVLNALADVQINQDATAGPIAITISDVETSAASLSLSFSSSNTTLVPNSANNLQETGSGPNRGLIIRPVTGTSGTSDITVTVRDTGKGDGSDAKTASKTFKLTVIPGEDPIISSVAAQTLNVNTFSDVISFTVSDAQTPAGNLTVTAESLSTQIIANSDIQFAPVDSSAPNTRRMIIKSGANPGTAQIRITVRDGDNRTSSTTFSVTVRGEAPTISSVANQTIQAGGTTGALSFTVADKETFPGFLTVTGTSSDTSFVPNANVVIGGSGANRTVTVTGAAGAEGSTTITLTVSDTEGQSATTSFVVGTPPPANSAPEISAIANQATEVGEPTGVIAFTLSDAETAAANFVNGAASGPRITAASSNTTLVPNANIFLGGSGANRTVFVSPAAGEEGTAVITITVADGGPGAEQSASTSFTLTVASNPAPTITAIADQSTQRGQAVSATFTVGDDKALSELTVTANSSNLTLVPSTGVAISGTGASRTITVTPAANQVGDANITVTVRDGGNKTASVTFKVTVTTPPATEGDLNGDGKTDILFRDADGFLAAWLMDGINLTSATFLIPSSVGDANYRVAGTGDFNSDGKEDILYQHTDGSLAVWYMNGVEMTSPAALNPSTPGDSNWRVVGTGRINSDNKVDLVFQHTDGTLAVWYMNGINLDTAELLNPSHPGDAGWKVRGVGDLNGDGRADLVFQHNDGTLAAWLMNGSALSSAGLLSVANAGEGWSVVGAADRNADGKADILFQRSDTTLGVWFMDGLTMSSASLLNPAASNGSWSAAGPR